jgi:hypothetical protein
MVVNPLTGKEEPRHGGLQLVRERYLGKRAARYEPYTLKQLRFIKQKLNGTLLAMLGYEIDLEEAAIAIERANARKKKDKRTVPKKTESADRTAFDPNNPNNAEWGPEFAVKRSSIFVDDRAKEACVASTAPLPGGRLLTCNETLSKGVKSISENWLEAHGEEIPLKAKTIWRIAGLVNSGTNFV